MRCGRKTSLSRATGTWNRLANSLFSISFGIGEGGAPQGGSHISVTAILKFLDSLRRLFDLIVVAANAAASGWIFVMMALITTDILLRQIFNSPISGVTEIVEISIVIVVYLQLTHTLKVGRMTRSDALYSTILRRFPAVGNIMGIVFSAAGVGLMLAIIKGGWPKWLQALHGGHFIGNSGVFTFPEWPQRLILVIGCAMLAIQFALMALDNIRALFGKPPLEYEEAVDVEVAVIEESLK